MAPPLALVAKKFLRVDCKAIIQEYAADKRAPHPVALLVKNIDAHWDASGDELTAYRWRQRFNWYGPRSDDVFTKETMKAVECMNKYRKRNTERMANEFNLWEDRSNIHPCLLGMHQEMQGCRFLPGSVDSDPENSTYTPSPYLNEAWTARGWDKRGSKRKFFDIKR